jgi:flagellar biosynthetic protein FliR
MVVSIAQAQLFFLALTRILTMIINVPVLGGQLIPNTVKLGLGIMLAMVLLPWQPLPADTPAMPIFVMGLGILQEMIIGLLAGFAAILTFGAVQIAANFMGLNTGFAAGEILNPTFGNRGAAYDNLFIMVCTLYFLVIDGHHIFLRGLALTFEAIPLHSKLPELSIQPLMHMTSTLIIAGVQLSLPIIGVVILTDLTLGLLARVAPQVPVFFLGIPLKLLISMLGLSVVFNFLLPSIRELFQALAMRGLELLGPG